MVHIFRFRVISGSDVTNTLSHTDSIIERLIETVWQLNFLAFITKILPNKLHFKVHESLSINYILKWYSSKLDFTAQRQPFLMNPFHKIDFQTLLENPAVHHWQKSLIWVYRYQNPSSFLTRFITKMTPTLYLLDWFSFCLRNKEKCINSKYQKQSSKNKKGFASNDFIK